jgi:hypothetical protein
MAQGIASRDEEEDPEGGVDPEDHLQVRRLRRSPAPPAGPEPCEGINPHKEDESKNGEG